MNRRPFQGIPTVVLLVSMAVAVLSCAGSTDARPGTSGGTASWGTIQLSRAVAWGVPGSGSITVGLVAKNVGESNHTITAISSAAGTAELHGVVGGAMSPLEELMIPPGKTLILGDGGPHIMITGVADSTWNVSTVPIVVEFSSGSTLLLEAAFLNYGTAMRVLRSK